MTLHKTLALFGALLMGSTGLATTARAAEHDGQQLYPLLSYRTGPYAPSGIPQWAGIRDYLTSVNEVQGGVDGVKVFVQECETAYTVERAFECYERYKNGYDGAPVAILMGTSSGFDAAASDKVRTDKLPLIDYIAKQVGGYDKLKGLKIATVYHDSGYGRDTIEPLATLSRKYGFEDIEIPVPHPGEQQQAQWQQIKQQGVDWVFFRAWGVMAPVGIKTAARVGFPADHIIGDIWTGSEEDVRPAGAAAKGYLAVSVFPSGTDYKISQTLKKDVVDAGKGDLKDSSKFGSVYYNAGLVTAIIYVEALRTGHKKFGNRPLTAAEGQWSLEHLDITPQRIEELGATGLLSPLKVTPTDHEGSPDRAMGRHGLARQDGLAERRPGALPRRDLRQGRRLRQGEEPPGARSRDQLTRRTDE
jgi:branched-chain amino acid transport system substrate-binding protein